MMLNEGQYETYISYLFPLFVLKLNKYKINKNFENISSILSI